MSPIMPPASLGILGGGQLGHMFVIAAKTMGYRVIVVDPDPAAPAARFADKHICQPYTEHQALRYLAEHCAAVTTEFENVDADALHWLERYVIVSPSAQCVAITQDRIREKTWINEKAALPTAPWLALTAQSDITPAVAAYLPGILKTARLGYDGKGQCEVNTVDEVQDAWYRFNQLPCVLEKRVPIKCEVSVIIARSASSETAIYPVPENQHSAGVLAMSMVPAKLAPEMVDVLQAMSLKLAETLAYIGVLAVEYFVLTDNTVVINELAPRPHNSGHYTLNACITDQFQQQVRTLCGLPPGSPQLLMPCVMANVLGDAWGGQGEEPNWQQVLETPNAHLYLYGKASPRPQRKMGHFTVLAKTVDEAYQRALALKETLKP